MNDTNREAAAMGFDLPSFFHRWSCLLLAAAPSPARKLRILLVECRGHDYPFYRQEIERATDGEVETLFLDESSLNDDVVREAAMRSDVVITTLNHAEETKALFARFDSKVIVIGAILKPLSCLRSPSCRLVPMSPLFVWEEQAESGWRAAFGKQELLSFMLRLSE